MPLIMRKEEGILLKENYSNLTNLARELSNIYRGHTDLLPEDARNIEIELYINGVPAEVYEDYGTKLTINANPLSETGKEILKKAFEDKFFSQAYYKCGKGFEDYGFEIYREGKVYPVKFSLDEWKDEEELLKIKQLLDIAEFPYDITSLKNYQKEKEKETKYLTKSKKVPPLTLRKELNINGLLDWVGNMHEKTRGCLKIYSGFPITVGEDIRIDLIFGLPKLEEWGLEIGDEIKITYEMLPDWARKVKSFLRNHPREIVSASSGILVGLGGYLSTNNPEIAGLGALDISLIVYLFLYLTGIFYRYE